MWSRRLIPPPPFHRLQKVFILKFLFLKDTRTKITTFRGAALNNYFLIWFQSWSFCRYCTQGDSLIERLLSSRKCILIAGLQWQPLKIKKTCMLPSPPPKIMLNYIIFCTSPWGVTPKPTGETRYWTDQTSNKFVIFCSVIAIVRVYMYLEPQHAHMQAYIIIIK